MKSTKPNTSWFSWVFAICVVISLSFYLILQNTSLTMFSLTGDKNNSLNIGTDTYNNLTLQPEVMIPTLQVGRARYDNQRILRIYDFYFAGNQWDELVDKYDVCFATQASLERFYWVPHILEKWSGPLSIAIQLISEEEWLIFNFYMNYLKTCHSAFESQAAIHLAVPANLSALKIDQDILSQWEGINLGAVWKQGETCPDAKLYMIYLQKMLPTRNLKKLGYKEFYPFNHMRNIARKGCGTHWTYSADVDTIPVDGMADKLQQFYIEQKSKGELCANCAYVIPSFELNYAFPFPESKKEVLELFRTGAAQPYHFTDAPPAQAATEYEYWASNIPEEETVTISHQINRTKLERYEPFYISPDNIDPFDERFVGYGSDRISQFVAAYTTGWNFSVLTPVFSIHWGLWTYWTQEVSRKGGFGESVREQQRFKNTDVFKRFVEELECKKIRTK